MGEVIGALVGEMNQRLGYVRRALLAVSRLGWSQSPGGIRWDVGVQCLSSSAASYSRELSFPRLLRIGAWKQFGWVLLATSRSHEVAVKMLAAALPVGLTADRSNANMAPLHN